jgi:hypothetical protein
MTRESTWPIAPGDLLSQARTPVPGLYRTHVDRNLSVVARTIADSYRGTGPLRLGPDRRLLVIAVDGLGYEHAEAAYASADLRPLTSEFPTTTVACLMASLTGKPACEHGFIGVQYLHADGQRVVNCHSGQVAGSSKTLIRPTATPDLLTVFDRLGALGVPSVVLPNELAGLHADVRNRMLHGAHARHRTGSKEADPVGLVTAFAAELSALKLDAGTLTWAYLDFDSHIHRYGFDRRVLAGAAALGELAGRLRDEGTSVLIFSDHGLTPSAPGQATMKAWNAVACERWCRLPAGGAGRVRWLYPHPGQAGRLAARLAGQLSDAFVTSPEELAELGVLAAGSVGQRRIGEVVLLATGPDFPVPDPSTAFEHGSMTAAEVVVPMAIWSAARL